MHATHTHDPFAAAAASRAGESMVALLCAAVRDVLGRARIGPVDADALAEHVRAGVFAEPIDAREREALTRGGDEARADRWIEARLERAMQSAIDRCCTAGVLDPPRAPRVLVLRGDGREERGLTASCTSEIEIASGDVVVLADAPGLDRFLERHQSLAFGPKTVRMHLRVGVDDRCLTVGFAPRRDAHGVEVFEVSTAFALLDELATSVLTGLARSSDAASAASATPGPATPHGAGADGDLTGSVLDGKYEVVARIGRGGFGSVYRARDLRLDHHVAIKVLHRGSRSLAALAALRDEARRLTRLDHPNIVDWKAFDETADGTGYIVMELLDGADLETVRRRETRLAPERVASVLHEIAQALCAAHAPESGTPILHLDLKPRNVVLLPSKDGGERVKVIDFGIAQHGGDAAHAPESDAVVEEPDGTLRSWFAVDPRGPTGGVARATACTPEYAAPEHCAHLLHDHDALALDGRADLYSLGVIGYELATGRLPFETPGRREGLLRLKLAQDAPSVASSGVALPRALCAFIDRCLARDREARFADALEACDALRRIVHRSQARRRMLAAGAACALSAALAVTFAPRAAERALDVVVRSASGETPLAGARLDFGPSAGSVEVRIPELTADGAAHARVVASRAAGAPPLAGARLELLGGDRARLSIDGWDGPPARTAFLELARDDGTTTHSPAFTACWIAPDTVRLASVRVAGLDGRALDPRGALLEIGVEGDVDAVERVEAASSGQRLAAHRDPARRVDGRAVWIVPLEPFAWSDGARSVEVTVVDRARGMRSQALELRIASENLVLDGVQLDAPRFGDRWSLAPGAAPTLSGTASRACDLSWRVVTDAGIELARGTSSSTRDLAARIEGLDLAARGAAFDGAIEVRADDELHVFHPRGHVPASVRLPIRFRPDRASLRAWASRGDGGADRPLEPGGTVHAPRRELELKLVRASDVPLRIEVDVQADATRTPAPETLALSLLDAAQPSATARIVLPDDGTYHLTLRAWRADRGDTTLAPPDVVETSTLVVQSQAPRLVLADAEGIVVRSLGALPRVRVSAATHAPVDVRWTVARAGTGAIVASGVAATPLEGRGALELELPLPLDASHGAATDELDGRWRVEVAGTDAAGNEAVSASFEYDVALRGPAAELLVPLARSEWTRGERGFELRIAARDPNGVGAVRCELARRGAVDDASLVCELEPIGRDHAGTLWSGNVELPASWSRAEVDVAIHARDRLGAATTSRATCRVTSLEGALPERLRVEHAGGPVVAMRLVRGNSEAAYVFGGRVDDLEDELFRRAGVAEYNSLQTSRSWQLDVPAGALASYYLDEHEVTVEEFAAFLRADDGFANASRWPAGAAPDAARRVELLARCGRDDPALPITGVTWFEAAAYAHWAGKRLPSALEWEYALRAGTAYRPFASWRDGAAFGRAFLAARALAPRGTSDDVATGVPFHDLSSNASEWTSTPAADGPDALRAALVAGEPRAAERFWVVGGSFASSRRDFSALDRRRASTRDVAIGFRCALSAAALVDGPVRPGGPRFVSTLP